jgi:hypothetical protein
MAMGKRPTEGQAALFVATAQLGRPGTPPGLYF